MCNASHYIKKKKIVRAGMSNGSGDGKGMMMMVWWRVCDGPSWGHERCGRSGRRGEVRVKGGLRQSGLESGWRKAFISKAAARSVLGRWGVTVHCLGLLELMLL